MILGLDIGEKRIGVATADPVARVAHPKVTLEVDERIFDVILRELEGAEKIVVGLPRNMDGEETAQSESVREFVEKLQASTDVEITMQDESLTSVEAERRLEASGKPYEKGDIDKEAATIILQDYLDAS